MAPVKSISSTEAKAKLNALLAEVETTGQSVTITNHGRPVAILGPAQPRPRAFGHLAGVVTVPDNLDEPLPQEMLAAWEGR